MNRKIEEYIGKYIEYTDGIMILIISIKQLGESQLELYTSKEEENGLRMAFYYLSPSELFKYEKYDNRLKINHNKALRYNNGKPKWSLINYESLIPLIRVLEFGANKYAPDNWKKEMEPKEILNSLQRHLADLMDGKTVDEESGLPLIGHIMANAMFYSYHTKENRNGK
jgi:hypothetical protein